MASLFNFRSRSASRDRETDAGRYDRLTRLLNQLSAEISAEKKGLEGRYSAASTNAAFLVEAMENDSASSGSSARVDELTTSILNCERRLVLLSSQEGLIAELRQSLATFVEENSKTDGPEDKARQNRLIG